MFSFADRVTVLVDGAIYAEGTGAEIARDPRVKAVYLGDDEAHTAPAAATEGAHG